LTPPIKHNPKMACFILDANSPPTLLYSGLHILYLCELDPFKISAVPNYGVMLAQ
jgi:hypothetical protein